MDYFEFVDNSETCEDEKRKEKSLQKFRDLLRNHKFIRKCRQDDIFLLQFLRKRKFSVDAALKTFENNLKLRKQHPEWFNTDPCIIARLKDLIRTGYTYTLKNIDSDGSRMVMINFQKCDLNKFDTDDCFRCAFLGTAIMHEFELNQNMKISYIFNFKNMPWSYFTSFRISDTIDWIKSVEACPGRYKKFIVIGLPSAAVKIYNILKPALNEKQRSRLRFINSLEELHQSVSPKILTLSFGGILPEEEIIEENIKVIDETLQKLIESNDFVIDDEYLKLENSENETFGSFRKLEID